MTPVVALAGKMVPRLARIPNSCVLLVKGGNSPVEILVHKVTIPCIVQNGSVASKYLNLPSSNFSVYSYVHFILCLPCTVALYYISSDSNKVLQISCDETGKCPDFGPCKCGNEQLTQAHRCKPLNCS